MDSGFRSVQFPKTWQRYSDLSCMCTTQWSVWDVHRGLSFSSILNVFGILTVMRSNHAQWALDEHEVSKQFYRAVLVSWEISASSGSWVTEGLRKRCFTFTNRHINRKKNTGWIIWTEHLQNSKNWHKWIDVQLHIKEHAYDNNEIPFTPV